MAQQDARPPLWVHAYPTPVGDVPDAEVFEIRAGQDVLVDDFECREHPEVPLTDAQRDVALARLGYRRTGPWSVDEDSATAPVEAVRR